jgi:hypothetical protein
LTDDLHDIGVHRGREVVRGLLGRNGGVLGELNLYQLVGAERIVDALAESVRQSVLPDVNRRAQMMRFRAKLGALLR